MQLPTTEASSLHAPDRHSGSGYAEWFGAKQAEIAARPTSHAETVVVLGRDSVASLRHDRNCCGLLGLFSRGPAPDETPAVRPRPRTTAARALAVALASATAPLNADRRAYVGLLHGQSSLALSTAWRSTSGLSDAQIHDGATTLYDLAHIRALDRVLPQLDRCSPQERTALVLRSGSVQDVHQRAITLATWGPQWSALTDAERTHLHNSLVWQEGFVPRSLVHFYPHPEVLPAKFYEHLLLALTAESRSSHKRDLAFYAAPLLHRFNEPQQHAFLSAVAGLRRSTDVMQILRNTVGISGGLSTAVRARVRTMLRVSQGRARSSATPLAPLRIQPVGPTG